MIFVRLFWSFFQIGLFSIGGGYAAMPLIQNQVVEINQWLTLTEYTDLITIAEMTPGPIAINAATFVGTQVAGLAGAVVCTLGCIAPSCIIVSVLAYFYFKYKDLALMQGILSGLRPAVVALIGSAGLSIIILAFWGEGGVSVSPDAINLVAVGLFIAAMFVLKRFKPNPILIMLGCGVVGGAIYLMI